jgi:hypothetical protein
MNNIGHGLDGLLGWLALIANVLIAILRPTNTLKVPKYIVLN